MHKILSDSPLRYINLFYFFKIRNLIKEERTEWLIIEHPYFGWLGWLLKRFCNVKLAVHTHNIEYERFRSIGKIWWKILRLYEKKTLNHADLVFCISAEDKQHMIDKMNIRADKCLITPYGITRESPPENKREIKSSVCKELDLDSDVCLLFFNGALQYKPNADALDVILNEINPYLLKENLKYKIIIAGKNLPERFNQLLEWKNKNVIYLGFVDDIDRYTIASDILLNTVTSGGGIKTKVVEALGMSTTVISTESGASGIKKEICGEKLILIKDFQWKEFAEKTIEEMLKPISQTPGSFYQTYSWTAIIKKTIASF
jgi:glycosyltransferase involved in cell wall biosynthesis